MRSAHSAEPVTVLDRIVVILEAVRDHGGAASVTQLAKATGIPKSTASRTVSELVHLRYLDRTETGVVIGLRLFELGSLASVPRSLSAAARPVLAELYNATGEHLNVAVRDGGDMVSVLSVRGRLQPAPSHVGVRVPASTTALGKAVLAFTVDQAVVRGVTPGLDARARHELEDELGMVRTRAVAVDLGETFPGVVGVASPILRADQTPVAAISVAGPESEMDAERMMPLVRHAAIALTRRLALQHR
jgi:IclR family acetate operon transcriptional repressor